MKNYKTTFISLFVAVLMAIQPLAENGFDFQKDWLKYLIAIGIAGLGFFTKDHNNEEQA